MRNKGFTLIEILVAATIVSVLSAIGMVSYASVNKRSRDAKRVSDLEQVRSALELYRADNGVYPGTVTGFVALTGLDSGDGTGPLVPTYLPSVPMDPQSVPLAIKTYFYNPVVGGTGTNFYSYCLCGWIETQAGKNECAPLGVTQLPAECNYGIKNP